ncbi:unnamed protein product [Mucor hiemalis]
MLSSHHKKLKPRLRVVPTKYSQSTPTTSAQQQQSEYLDDPPYSPAASTNSFISSVSWVAEKSASELSALLKNAYHSLREKEKNLLLAAEIGKSLLEHNQNLKRDYDKLLQNAKKCESSIVSTTTKEEEEEEHTMRLISSKKAYDSIIESLERKNAEIQQLLDQQNHNSSLTEQQYEKKQRKLESEIDILKGNLDSAANKISELEELNQHKHQQWKMMDERRDFEQKQKTDDLELMEELTHKMQELFMENKQLQHSKKSVEEKLILSLNDLEELRKNFEEFELTHQGYQQLQESFTRQTQHVEELNYSLEEHRHILSRLKEKGLLSHTPSVCQNNPSTSTTCSQQSLMGELENAFSYSTATNNNKRTRSHSDSNISTLSKIYDLATLTERNITSFYNAPGDYAFDTILSSIGIDNRSMLNEAELLLTRTSFDEGDSDLFEPQDKESYAELDLYPNPISSHLLRVDPKPCQMSPPPKGLSNRILFHIRYLFRSIFRWCRFAIILVTAVLINLWKGPDLILEK